MHKPTPYDATRLYEFALRALGARAHSTGDLRAKLARRAAREEDVEATLDRLREYGYLDDRRYAESFASARLNNDGFGKSRVLRDLAQRRIAPTIAEQTVGRIYAEVDEQTLIEEWIRRRYRNVPREGLFQEQKDLASAYRRLMHAGFRTGEIIRALKRFAHDPELMDGFEPPEDGGADE